MINFIRIYVFSYVPFLLVIRYLSVVYNIIKVTNQLIITKYPERSWQEAQIQKNLGAGVSTILGSTS